MCVLALSGIHNKLGHAGVTEWSGFLSGPAVKEGSRHLLLPLGLRRRWVALFTLLLEEVLGALEETAALEQVHGGVVQTRLPPAV